MKGLPPNFRSYLADVDARLASFFPRRLKSSDLARYLGTGWSGGSPAAQTRMISRPVWELISRRGKRWRPVFGRLLLESLGAPWDPFGTLMTAVSELNHTGSLIIDDIEDGSLQRRGGPAVHLRHGIGPAINAANTIYFLPYLLIRENRRLKAEQKLELYRIMVEQMSRSHFGQALDLYWTERLRSSRALRLPSGFGAAAIVGIYELKTASGLAGLAEYAAVIARAPSNQRKACVEFARCFGTAFQIADDVLDLAGGEGWRKRSGEDLAEGKITYAVYRALRSLAPPRRRRLLEILKTPALRGSQRFREEALGLVRSSGALEACREEARGLAGQGWRRFCRHLPDSPPRRELRRLCDALLGAGRRF